MPTLLRWCWLLPWLQPLFGLGLIQTLRKQRMTATVRGPDAGQRQRTPTWVWGGVTNAGGIRKIGRVQTTNGYDVTVQGALAVVERLLTSPAAGGYYTPAQLLGAGLVETLPGSSPIRITET